MKTISVTTINTLIRRVKILREDMRMLRDGEWEPDEDSCNASIDNADAVLITLTRAKITKEKK